ncbi:MAG: hypothetical protein A2Y61_02655 [Chloroflexi bacterium RBG_13_60_13]|nr:MAG: hypothetical protein A2Y61_02655 [Chloroflexi bacterium RBG_13_60_13]
MTDPWDHVECAIALDLTGRFDQAVRAYEWLIERQNADGSWYSTYVDDEPQDLTRDPNYSSYIATGVWYHYGLTGDRDFLRRMWHTVEEGIGFALSLQQPSGEVYCVCDANGQPWPGAITGSSCCIWQSLQSGVKIAETLNEDGRHWRDAGQKLLKAIREHPELFEKFGENKQGFATNWYYPVLTGVVDGEEARRLILDQWDTYVVDKWGCKCVSSAPWVTVAETTELIMTLCRMGQIDRARLLMEWMLRLKDHNGGFHTGIKLPEMIIWPEEKNTWTSAGVIMATMAYAKVEAAHAR